MPNRFYLGVDGGGTRCRVRIRATDGRLIAEAEGGLANVNQDRAQAIATIMDTVWNAAKAGGMSSADFARTYAGLGLAGVTDHHVAADIARVDWPFAKVIVDDDAYIACLGAHNGADGGIIIAGTGSAGLCLVGGRRFGVGGRGFALGDEGSSAHLGLAALRAAMSALDGLEARTPLTEELLAGFNADAGAMARWGVRALPRDYAQYAPQVFSAAEAGDPIAIRLVAHAADALDKLARRLMDFGARKLCLVGGMARRIEAKLAPDVRAILAEPVADPLEGAMLMAAQATSLEKATETL
jgi:glucosamine kinase